MVAVVGPSARVYGAVTDRGEFARTRSHRPRLDGGSAGGPRLVSAPFPLILPMLRRFSVEFSKVHTLERALGLRSKPSFKMMFMIDGNESPPENTASAAVKGVVAGAWSPASPSWSMEFFHEGMCHGQSQQRRGLGYVHASGRKPGAEVDVDHSARRRLFHLSELRRQERSRRPERRPERCD